jgi:hypothetical protein
MEMYIGRKMYVSILSAISIRNIFLSGKYLTSCAQVMHRNECKSSSNMSLICVGF